MGTEQTRHREEDFVNSMRSLGFQNAENNLDPNNFQRFETEPATGHNQIVIEHQKSKPTKSYKNPIVVIKSSIKLEKDAMKPNIYYINFKYISLLNFDMTILLNPIHHKQNEIQPNENFKLIKITNIKKGNDEWFFDKEAFINVDEYLNSPNRKTDKDYFDIVIELSPFKENGDIECTFATYCNLIPFNLNNINIEANPAEEDALPKTFNFKRMGVKIRADFQKLKVRNNWFKLHNIYGLDGSVESASNDCEACCFKKKNTIFLPCKHSYACNDCSLIVRMPNNNCPLCRQLVTDCLIIDDNKN